ncbi:MULTISPECIES: glycoside hydrolase family 31 protein [Chryseobacterium]|uniref:Alpha-D-xyloside xylohydrolase n=1 Tax=Chryseobacterium camelliae TaxID=1265445 RepID=A0ABU0TG84_9FLAO|nr:MULTISPECIES: TIM-barrel domain-containing protein [Chryseobacterium]MDT3406128.1 alpha-D-xyloside xylohydrolase [Pseudacidovorax intermedius]MDQ1096068.1 alpha-D-xyloside xylohydrolase [Chryseobacterium camelliae]MDQ1100006.1 alpha-D-xyloside xylohydrolase [Chryseobacterium sp. SORGH_AS_1048]MDR6087350.1 alpha-D-xyloside xylohydrolase [Chryseobacterium sp. SORGH_AS_0909]MDR6131725.1 alpha-D-xyloside xylohydrolase [Chryseobacterium sp. SORGH_AS_1175]
MNFNTVKTRIFFLTVVMLSGNTDAQSYKKTDSGLSLSAGNLAIEVKWYGGNTVRVMKYPVGKSWVKNSLAIIQKEQQTRFSVSENNDVILLKSDHLQLSIDVKTGKISYRSPSGQELLKETGSNFKPFNDVGNQTLSVSQSFQLEKEEPIYGLGILQNGKMSQRNTDVKMIQNNTWDFIPFFQSVKGYGVFWDNESPTQFTDTPQQTSFSSEVGEGIDYYFIYGKNADGVVAGIRNLTGNVPMLPLWTYGYWQSKERYKSQDELVDVVKKYRELKVPLDGIIQDWQYWGNNYQWNAMDFISLDFPDAKKMIQDIHDNNAHLSVSIWSSFGPMTHPYREMDQKGMLFNFKTWPESGRDVWPPDMNYPSGVRVYDAYNPEARNMYWKYLNKGLFSLGVDSWWMDSTEPDHLSQKPEDLDTKTYLGSFRKVRNAYPLMTVGGVYDHQRETTGDKRVFILTRSAFAGQQRYGANTWSGDVNSSWEMLRNQVPAGLNFSLTGNPNFNSDIGGFFAGVYRKNGGAKSPVFQELYVRWLQYGTFTPMMRSHGTDVPREIYQFGKKGDVVYDAIEKFIRLRYSMLPYIYSVSHDVSKNNSSFLRAVSMDFSSDKNTWDINNEYLFGKSLLVAPVLHAQYTPEKIITTDENQGWNKDNGTKKENQDSGIDFTQNKTVQVYLPAGTDWFDFWTNQKHSGGQKIEKSVTLQSIPLYVKAGSIIPFGPDVQYATEKKWDYLTVKIYPGADADFVLYEDEFDNYNYEKGAFTEIPFHWNEKSKTLTVEARKGKFNGMIEKRNFSLLLPGGQQKTVNYSGKKINVSFK